MNDRQFREHLAELLNRQRNPDQPANKNPPTPEPTPEHATKSNKEFRQHIKTAFGTAKLSRPADRRSQKEATEIRTLEAISRLGKESGRRDLENASRGTEEAACQRYENVYRSPEIEMKHEG